MKIDWRRLARGVALQALYELDQSTHPEADVIHFHSGTPTIDARTLGNLVLRSHMGELPEQDEEAIADKTSFESLSLKEQKRAIKLVRGVLEHKQDLDNMIQRYSPDYPIDQMAIVDRNILRIALFEFYVSGEIPVTVAINEAVEVAKLFGGDTAPSFINGVLGSLAKERRAKIESTEKEADE